MEIKFNNEYIDPNRLKKSELIQAIKDRDDEIKSLKKKCDLYEFTRDGLESFADVIISIVFDSPSLAMQLRNRLKILLKDD